MHPQIVIEKINALELKYTMSINILAELKAWLLSSPEMRVHTIGQEKKETHEKLQVINKTIYHAQDSISDTF